MRDNYDFLEMNETYLPDITRIYNYYVTNSTATFHTRTQSIEDMRQIVFFNNGLYTCYVIIRGSEVCGYCILSPYHKREAFVGTAEISVYLAPEHSGKGLGGLAFDFVEELARARKLQVLIAAICHENEASIKLCERKGYVKCGHFKKVGKKFERVLDVVYYQKLMDDEF